MYVNDGNRRFGCIRGYFDYITRTFFCDYMYFYSRSKHIAKTVQSKQGINEAICWWQERQKIEISVLIDENYIKLN